MRKRTRIIAVTLAIIAILLAGGGILLDYIKNHYAQVAFSAQEQREIPDLLDIPDSGWYQLYAYRLKPDTPLAEDQLYLQEKDSDGQTYRLALLEFNLSSYRDRALDDTARENIQRVLSLFQKTAMRVILRFLYDWDGKGLEGEPEKLSLVKKHMTQAGEAVNPYHDSIFSTQGIFVGSWGEMHTSRYLSTENMTELLLQLAQSIHSSIYLAVRTPSQYREIMDELERHPDRYQKYRTSREELSTRLGLFNDGMLGSLSDVGTYHAADIAGDEQKGEAIREKEIAFQGGLCLQAPNGGEVVNDNPRNDWEPAISDLRRMRVSYLNQIYDEKVIEKWKKSAYTGADALFHGMSAYDYISRHLGARFVLRDAALHYETWQTRKALGTVTVENVGFSNMYREQMLTIAAIAKDTGRRKTLLSCREKEEEEHPCRWSPGETVALDFQLDPMDLASGEYTLMLSLTDPASGKSIPFANDSYQEKLGGCVLGTLHIKHL